MVYFQVSTPALSLWGDWLPSPLAVFVSHHGSPGHVERGRDSRTAQLAWARHKAIPVVKHPWVVEHEELWTQGRGPVTQGPPLRASVPSRGKREAQTKRGSAASKREAAELCGIRGFRMWQRGPREGLMVDQDPTASWGPAQSTEYCVTVVPHLAVPGKHLQSF